MNRKMVIGLVAILFYGCSHSINKSAYQEVHLGDRQIASVPSASYIETINSHYNKSIVPGNLGKLIDGKKRLDLIFEYARKEPLNFFRELREKAPVFHSKKAGKIPDIYVVSTNVLVKEVLNENRVFTVKPYTKQMDASVGPFMLGHEDSAPNPHKKGHKINFPVEKMAMRHLIYKTGNDLSKVKKITSAVVKSKLDHSKKVVDIVKDISRDVPIRVVQEYFGFKASTKSMKRWSRATQHSFFHNPTRNRETDLRAKLAGREMKDFLVKYISKVKRELKSGKRKNNTDTITAMIRATKAHSQYGLDSTRLATNIMGLLVGAVETGSAAINQSLQFILNNPDIYDQAVAAAKEGNDDLLSKIVWEALRFNPVNPWVARVSAKDFTLSNGVTIKKGSLVLAATESAMFDESVFENPELFSTNRKHEDYFHLGFARHRCLGDDVAMAFVPETIKQLLLLPHLRRAEAGSTPDFKKGPFPEEWKLKWSDGEYANTWLTLPKRLLADRWIPDSLGGYIAVKLYNGWGGNKKEIYDTLKKLVGSENKDEGVIKFSLTAKNVLDQVATPGELKEACMDINKLSHTVFPDIDQRAKYCVIRFDFRACYALSRKLSKKSSEESYNFCANENNFLTRDEKNLFKENFKTHPNFNFL